MIMIQGLKVMMTFRNKTNPAVILNASKAVPIVFIAAMLLWRWMKLYAVRLYR